MSFFAISAIIAPPSARLTSFHFFFGTGLVVVAGIDWGGRGRTNVPLTMSPTSRTEATALSRISLSVKLSASWMSNPTVSLVAAKLKAPSAILRSNLEASSLSMNSCSFFKNTGFDGRSRSASARQSCTAPCFIGSFSTRPASRKCWKIASMSFTRISFIILPRSKTGISENFFCG